MTSRAIQIAFFLTIFGLTAVLGFFIFKPYFSVIVLAATSAIIFFPMYEKFSTRAKGKHGLAAFMTILVALIIVLAPLSLLGTRVFSEATGLYDRINQANETEQSAFGDFPRSANPTIAKIQDRVSGFVTESSADLKKYVQNWLTLVVTNFSAIFQSIASAFLGIFLWILAFYYFLRDGHEIKKILVMVSPLSDRYDQEILNKISVSVKSVVGGTLIVALLQGILSGAGFALFGVPNPAIWGALAVITALIPSIGTALVIVPTVAYLLLIGSTVPAIGLLLWGLILVNSVDNLLRPKLIERGTRVHPFIILLSVLGGLGLFGPIGFLVGPIIVSLLYEFVEIYKKLILHQEPQA